MARVLQVRRGTAAQNNNFTGLSGEISFDTDAKTLRVHDGETLGGFALARADSISGGGGDFDITTVSDDFWQELFNRFATAGFSVVDSRSVAIKNNAYTEYIFAIDKPAKIIQSFLVCQTPEAGYSIGDTVWAFGIDNMPSPAPNTFNDTDGMHIRFMIGSKKFWVCHKTTGLRTEITNENWRLQFRVYY